ncbi:hypothetical protein ACFYOY_13450 [Streptomyces sp. NPDC007875]|uniref:hypothetical protein n=1 Tax=Streptomyces sp. NPDC007875 TaxID=3364783 RepID=UPI0036BAD7DF
MATANSTAAPERADHPARLPLTGQTRAAFIAHFLGARAEGRTDLVKDILLGAKTHDASLADELRGIQAVG